MAGMDPRVRAGQAHQERGTAAAVCGRPGTGTVGGAVRDYLQGLGLDPVIGQHVMAVVGIPGMLGGFPPVERDHRPTSPPERAAALKEQIARRTEQIILAAARVGQHVFAVNVLSNCGQRCVFCGLKPLASGAKRMLMAGHIKPWKDSAPSERLDLRNGLAACPDHDVAFDTGLLTAGAGPRVRRSHHESFSSDSGLV